MAPTPRYHFYTGDKGRNGSSGSSGNFGCTRWRCVLVLLVAAGAGTISSLWVSMTQDLATPGKRAEDPFASALAYSLMARLSQPLSSLSYIKDANLLSNAKSKANVADLSSRKKLHSHEDSSVSNGSTKSANDFLIPHAPPEIDARDSDKLPQKKPVPADVSDTTRTAVGTTNFPVAPGTTAVGLGRTLGGTTFSKDSSPKVAADAAMAASAGESLGMRSDGRMNVLMVVADDMRSQSMVYGKADTYTPSLARLAARGVVFDRAYAQVTVCNPSRNSFMTGRTPDVTQVWNFENQVLGAMVSLPTYFRGQGYVTLCSGKVWHWGPGPGASWSDDLATMWPESSEYQKMIRHERAIQNATVTPIDLPPDDYMDARIANRALKLLELLANGDKEFSEKTRHVPRHYQPHVVPNRTQEQILLRAGKSVLDARPPFLLAVGFHLPHEPYVFPTKIWKQYDQTELPMLRGRIARRPFGMPPYALGDVQAPFSYFDKSNSDGGGESLGRTYGPHLWNDPKLSPLTNFMKEHPYPDPMRRELLKGYMAGVTYMDSQLGKVLDKLSATGLEESTVVCFFSDHGFALGERGQWGKRSLFESDTRVPLIFADPRHPKAHGTRTPALAELVDVFPTLTQLAGLPPPFALVPPINGVSQAAVVHEGGLLSSEKQGRNAAGISGTLERTKPRSAAISQFSRCPIVASEFLTELSGSGPMVLKDPQRVLDYRSRPHHNAAGWACKCKGWQWGDHHDLPLMGYSLRVDGWRYTAWLPWDSNATEVVWVWPPIGEELYAHEADPNEPPGLFDETETTNLLSVDGVGKALFSGTVINPLVTRVQAKHRAKSKELFMLLRRHVLERRGIADDSYYMCNRVRGYEQCVKRVASEMGFDASLTGQLAVEVDSRGLQRSRSLVEKINAAVPQAPFPNLPDSEDIKRNAKVNASRATLTTPISGSAPSASSSTASTALKTLSSFTAGLPSKLEHKLRRVAMMPDQALHSMSEQIAAFERVAEIGDIVSVGSVETRVNALQQYLKTRGDQHVPSAAATSWGGVRYAVKDVIRTPELVSADLMALPLPAGTYSPSASKMIGLPVDLLLEMVPRDGGDANVCASDTQAMGLGYVPHVPTAKLRDLKPEAKRELPSFDNTMQWETRNYTSESDKSSSCLPSYMGPFFDSDGVNAAVLPKQLYVPSRAPALATDASWTDRTQLIHWLPENLHDFDRRLGLRSSGAVNS